MTKASTASIVYCFRYIKLIQNNLEDAIHLDSSFRSFINVELEGHLLKSFGGSGVIIAIIQSA